MSVRGQGASTLNGPGSWAFRRGQCGEVLGLEAGGVLRVSDVLGPPRPGKSVAYCLDTRPCANSAELARGVDLLIHEATYTDEFAVEARQYGHSTAAQAAQTARDA